MPFDDLVSLSFVMFNKHVNLGGASAKFLQLNGNQTQLDLHPSGMVRVEKAEGVFWVSAACIESCQEDPARVWDGDLASEAPNAEAGHEKADILKNKAAKSTKTRDSGPKTGKMTDSQPPMSRADEILAELGN